MAGPLESGDVFHGSSQLTGLLSSRIGIVLRKSPAALFGPRTPWTPVGDKPGGDIGVARESL